MQFERNPIKNDRVTWTATADIDRQPPFCQPSWLSDGEQNKYSSLNNRVDEGNSFIKFGRNLIKND